MRSLLFSLCLGLLACSALAGCGRDAALPAPPSSPLAQNEGRPIRAALSATSRAEASDAPQVLCAPVKDPNVAQCLGFATFSSAWGNSSAPAGGLQPSDLASLYGILSWDLTRPTNQTIGIVVAYHNASLESDLATFRSFFSLPPCTSANGCLIRTGAANVATTSDAAVGGRPESVSANPTNPDARGWAAESDADVEAASATCPRCRIVVAEAASPSLSDLGDAVGAAVRAGATIVSASFGAPESPAQAKYEAAFEPGPSVKVVAAAGDSPGVFFPAAATNVVAVAGTSLRRFGFVTNEVAWPSSGGGCSGVFARPAWQLVSTCPHRSVADVSAIGDPSIGLAVYASPLGGWGTMGGTSISAPIVAGMWALSGDTGALPGAQRLYQHSPFFFNVNLLSANPVGGLGIPLSLLAF